MKNNIKKNKKRYALKHIFFVFQSKPNYFLGFLMFACAAASLAIGTLNGEHET